VLYTVFAFDRHGKAKQEQIERHTGATFKQRMDKTIDALSRGSFKIELEISNGITANFFDIDK